MTIFESFETGKGTLPTTQINFANIDWSSHPQFEGVTLKHLITSKDTDGTFSFHLVRITPHHEIGFHMHETQLETHEIICGSGTCITDKLSIAYTPGTINILPATLSHRIIANEEGLYLFAKFIPALC